MHPYTDSTAPFTADDLDPAGYIRDRVDGQIAWHSKNSGKNKTRYHWLTVLNIILAACIPFLSGIAIVLPEAFGVLVLPLVVSGIGVLLTIVAGMLSLFKFHENWVDYRLISESLTREKFLYLARAEVYDEDSTEGADPFPLFVERTEGLIAKTVAAWGRNASRKVLSKKSDKAEDAPVAGGTDARPAAGQSETGPGPATTDDGSDKSAIPQG